MDKQYTSNVEDKRLNIEEQQLTMGQHILPQQIWRDGALIPGSPDDLSFKVPELVDGVATQTSYFNDGQTVHGLVEKISRLPIKKVRGTSNVFYNERLINLIGREFDNDPTNKKKSWQYIIYSSQGELAYGMGDPIVDVATGNLIFRNEDFVKTNTEDIFFITFYKYIGRTGLVGATDNEQDNYGGIDLPFRDDIKHFKDADNDERTATFVLEGQVGNTLYILPNAAEVYDGRNIELDEYGKSTSKDHNRGTVMLQENYQEIDWNIGWHNGGVWLPDGTVRKN